MKTESECLKSLLAAADEMADFLGDPFAEHPESGRQSFCHDRARDIRFDYAQARSDYDECHSDEPPAV